MGFILTLGILEINLRLLTRICLPEEYMVLHTLLVEHETAILEKCRLKVAKVVDQSATSKTWDVGLPMLYAELVEVLRISCESDSAQSRQKYVYETVRASASRAHALEAFSHGFTVSQLVHGYGCICQGITEYAVEENAPITAAEFGQLNLCLDVAIAQAVTEYEALRSENAGQEASLQLGYLAHELRNSLSSAMMAHELIKGGDVATAGATSAILSNSLQAMKHIIDRAMMEVRIGEVIQVERVRIQILNLLGKVESAARPEANERSITLHVQADSDLETLGDRHLIASAVANLVQNAIKFTKPNSSVWVRARLEGDEIVIDVEDRCGGLPEGKTAELFVPYKQAGANRSGLGLGLAIAQRAVQLNDGTLTAMDLPGVGCVFTIRLKSSKGALVDAIV